MLNEARGEIFGLFLLHRSVSMHHAKLIGVFFCQHIPKFRGDFGKNFHIFMEYLSRLHIKLHKRPVVFCDQVNPACFAGLLLQNIKFYTTSIFCAGYFKVHPVVRGQVINFPEFHSRISGEYTLVRPSLSPSSKLLCLKIWPLV